jgi:hypothetical protein
LIVDDPASTTRRRGKTMDFPPDGRHAKGMRPAAMEAAGWTGRRITRPTKEPA